MSAEHKIPEGEPRRWLDEPKNVAKIYYGLIVICVALALADLFYHKHSHYAVEQIIGAYGIYGFVCCVGLVLVAKEMRKILMRGEDYYDADR